MADFSLDDSFAADDILVPHDVTDGGNSTVCHGCGDYRKGVFHTHTVLDCLHELSRRVAAVEQRPRSESP